MLQGLVSSLARLLVPLASVVALPVEEQSQELLQGHRLQEAELRELFPQGPRPVQLVFLLQVFLQLVFLLLA